MPLTPQDQFLKKIMALKKVAAAEHPSPVYLNAALVVVSFTGFLMFCADNNHTSTFICHQTKPAQSPETRKSTRLASNAVETSPRKSMANPTTKGRVRSCVTGTQEDAIPAKDPNPITETVEPHQPTPDPLQNDPSYRSEYVGRVVSFTELATNRPAHGLVENYITGQGYSVLCKYIDELEPPESVQEWPLQWIEEHLVDETTAKAWYDALTDQAKLNSPTSGNSRPTK